jgi:hypothetical protein
MHLALASIEEKLTDLEWEKERSLAEKEPYCNT